MNDRCNILLWLRGRSYASDSCMDQSIYDRCNILLWLRGRSYASDSCVDQSIYDRCRMQMNYDDRFSSSIVTVSLWFEDPVTIHLLFPPYSYQ